jgi:hypothetical protein
VCMDRGAPVGSVMASAGTFWDSPTGSVPVQERDGLLSGVSWPRDASDKPEKGPSPLRFYVSRSSRVPVGHHAVDGHWSEGFGRAKEERMPSLVITTNLVAIGAYENVNQADQA